MGFIDFMFSELCSAQIKLDNLEELLNQSKTNSKDNQHNIDDIRRSLTTLEKNLFPNQEPRITKQQWQNAIQRLKIEKELGLRRKWNDFDKYKTK